MWTEIVRYRNIDVTVCVYAHTHTNVCVYYIHLYVYTHTHTHILWLGLLRGSEHTRHPELGSP